MIRGLRRIREAIERVFDPARHMQIVTNQSQKGNQDDTKSWPWPVPVIEKVSFQTRTIRP